MDPDLFKRSRNGKVVKVGQGVTAYWSFVPNPLPPEIDYDKEMVALLSKADRALGELSGIGRMLPNPHLLIQPFIRHEAVLSSKIEGTQTDIKGLYVYEAGQLALPGMEKTETSDAKEVNNYVKAMQYGLERQETLPVSLRLIRELHERLMEGVRGDHTTPGEFRRSQNWIGRPGCTLNEVDFVPPSVDEMQKALNLFEKYLHADDAHPSLIRLGLIHYQFEAIHPFIDGNGRIGRLLIPLLMVCWNILPLPMLYLSAYFERNRQQYYDHLMGVSQRGDWRAWLLFFLAGVGEQALEAVNLAKRFQDLQEIWRKKLLDRSVRAPVFKLIDRLFELPVLTIPEAQKIMKTKYYPTAKKAIDMLVAEGIIEQFGEAKYGKVFIAMDILREIEKSRGSKG